ncbi:MAG: retron Ec67 family RNA-directed DNA polymerase/endonuclease [Gammaproteobacteria bacterium]|nr:retron Ec67 family RNA-directed DNA polymerase/endonuclease [Gammaproteobacteria bacterium]
MSHLERLKSATNRKDLARLLGYQPSALTSIIYRTPLAKRYTTFEIPKGSGGSRIIKAPIPKLKKLQRHLANLLCACLVEIDKNRDVSPVSYGFRKGETLAGNAKNHKRRRYVLNLDLKDFFPTFNFGRVRGFFLKDNSFKLAEEVATTIAQIACDGSALPQGSPCSPIISELVARFLDVRLLRFAKKHGVRYSRYADDIVFSTNQKEFPVALAVKVSADPSSWILGDDLIAEIEGAGFKINTDKTRMHCRGSRQMVTGLVVNEKVNIRREYYRNARAMCDSLFQTGAYFRSLTPNNTSCERPKTELIASLNPLEGILSHIYSVTQSEERRSIQEQRKRPRAIRVLYRRFLFYKYCIALEAPLIITEGKTDPVYLKEAIRHRSAFHPILGCKGEDGFGFAVRFFNYGGQAHEIIGLRGGTGDLKSIVLDFQHNLKSGNGRKLFNHRPMKYPVILVLDNDEGLKPVASIIKRMFDLSITTDSTESFYHIVANLYLVKIPENGVESCIEDLFPSKWKEKSLNGKDFSAKNDFDPETQYGKQVFANSVIKPDAHQIDFSGFDPLLKRIAAVICDYRQKLGE